MAEENSSPSEEPTGSTAASEGDSGRVKDLGTKPALQAIAVSTGVIAAAVAAAAVKYLAG